MPSINDWALKAAQEIQDHYPLTDELVASIITAHAGPLIALLRESRREHYHTANCSDECCPACDAHGTISDCTCGAAEWNARIDAALGSEVGSGTAIGSTPIAKPRPGSDGS